MEQPMIVYVETPLVCYYTCLRCEYIFLSHNLTNHNCVHITTDAYSDDETDYETEDTDDTDTDDDTDIDETDPE